MKPETILPELPNLPFTQENAERVLATFMELSIFMQTLETAGLSGLPDPKESGIAATIAGCRKWLCNAMREADRISGHPIRTMKACGAFLDRAATNAANEANEAQAP